MEGEDGFELSAAGLRADRGELALWVEVLAAKLESALPGSTHVARGGRRLLSREKHVQSVRGSSGQRPLCAEGVLHRAPNGRPFTRDLSGQDFWTLLRTGHRPVGMVMGSCVYHVAHQGMLKSLSQTGRNVELPNFTQALYDARELAMERMQAEAQELRSEGIVGVDLQEKSHGWGSHVIEFFAIGTAIVPSETQAPIEAPTPVLDLSDRPRS